MRIFRNIILYVVLLAGISLSLRVSSAPAIQAQGANLLQNPGFEAGFYTFNPDDYTWVALYPSQRDDCKMDDGTYLPCNTAQTPVGWIPWWISQSDSDPDWKNRMPEYKPAEQPFANRIHSGNFAAQYFTFHGTHTAGLLQVVDVPANARVRFTIWGQAWSSASDANYSDFPSTVNMRIGIDPTGGTNPYNSAIQWSDYKQPYDAYQEFSVEAQANGNKVTVFTISSPDEARKHNDIYWDDASLTVIGGGAPPPQPTATTAPSGSDSTGNDTGNDNSGTNSGTAGGATAVSQAPPATGPTSTPDAEGVIYAEVQSGDSYWSIAARHGLTIDEIYELNNTDENDVLQPGEKVIVGHAQPSSSTQATSEDEQEASEGEAAATAGAEETGTPEAEATTEATPASPTPPSPTLTSEPQIGEVCISAFVDDNQNGQHDAGEGLQSGVAFTIYDGEQVLVNYVTDGSSEPYCIKLDPGNYRITRSQTANEVLTTQGEWAISVSGTSSQQFEFGSYVEEEVAAVSAQGSGEGVQTSGDSSGEASQGSEAEATESGEGGITRLIVIAAVVVAVLLLVGVLVIILSARRSTV